MADPLASAASSSSSSSDNTAAAQALSSWSKSLTNALGGSIYSGGASSWSPLSTFSSSPSSSSATTTTTMIERTLTSPLLQTLQSELLPLILCEIGFFFATVFAAYEVWVTRERAIMRGRAGSVVSMPVHMTGHGGDGTPPLGQRGGSRVGGYGGGGGGGMMSAKRSMYSYGGNRRGSVDTHDGSRVNLEKMEMGGDGGAAPTTVAAGAGRDGAGATGGGKDGQSSGDSTRRSFFNLLFLALLCRLLLLPVQAFYFAPSSHHIHPETGMCMSSAACIFSRTLPDMCFASAFSLLVLFYAQLAGTASGGGPRGLSYFLTRRRLFQTCNIIVYTVYALLYIFTAFVPHVPYALFQTCIWSMLCLIYATLLGTLSYFGPYLLKLLRPSLARRVALAMRLSATCFVCAAVFLSRTICFAFAVYNTDYRWTHGIAANAISDTTYRTQFDQNVLGYTLLELLPSVFILAMMHQHKPRSGSTQSPSAAAGTTPPHGLTGSNRSGSGSGSGSGNNSYMAAGQIAATSAAADGSGQPPGRSSPGGPGGPGGVSYEWSVSTKNSIRRSLSGSAAQSKRSGSVRGGLGLESVPLLDGRVGGGSGYGAANPGS